MKEFVNYIKRVDQDDDLYCSIYNQPLITNNDIYEEFNDRLYAKLDELMKRFNKIKYLKK